MKLAFVFLSIVILMFPVSAQKTPEVLATADGKSFTESVISPELRSRWENREKNLAAIKAELFSEQVAEMLFALEASERKTSVEKLLETEINSKIPAPTESQIKTIYELNRAALGDKTLEQARPQIAAFLKFEPEKKLRTTFVSSLKAKFKPVFPSDIGSSTLKPTDILANISGKTITYKDFQDRNRAMLYETEYQLYEAIDNSLKNAVFNELLAIEAASQNLSAGDIFAREVSDKMRNFSNEERANLENALINKLFTKYKVKFTLTEPVPLIQNISIGESDPKLGNQTAPVKVVMFSDFQCPACAAVHPIVKSVTADYKQTVLFVLRDFPLMSVHENAFKAAEAANAANAQGKFFEYIELLYNNQDALDNASLKEYATKIGLDRKKFDADLDSGKFAGEVRKDMADGKIYGVNSTPTIFVNGVKVRDFSTANFKAAIETALKKSK